MTKHALTRPLTLIAVLGLLVAACSSPGASPSAPASAPASEPPAASAPGSAPASGATSEIPPALIEAAKAEGNLTTIALPHDWCNYGEVIESLQGQVRHRRQRAESGRQLG